MTPALWYFLRLRSGELRSIPSTRVAAFFERGGVLPAGEDGFVRYVEVIVLLEARRAVDVHRIAYVKHHVDADGRLDSEHLHALMSAVTNAVSGPIGRAVPARDVVEAGDRFARRRMEHLGSWKPTDSDLAALRDVVNAKAGRRLM